MPVYEFKCANCKAEREVTLPFSESDRGQVCDCGEVMRRKLSPINFSIPQTGRDGVLKTLNRERGGYTYPGGEMHGARYDQAMAKGLYPPKQVVGRGFG